MAYEYAANVRNLHFVKMDIYDILNATVLRQTFSYEDLETLNFREVKEMLKFFGVCRKLILTPIGFIGGTS